MMIERERLLIIAQKQLSELEYDYGVSHLIKNLELGVALNGRQIRLIEAYKAIEKRIKNLKKLEKDGSNI